MYDQFAGDYDRFVNWQNRLSLELPFIEQSLSRLGRNTAQKLDILDAACGTGMHALALAKEGHSVSGADFSSKMIDLARQNAASAGLTCRFETAGFGSLAKTFGGQQFDAVLCMGNSLPHLITRTDLEAAVVDFAACLRPGGLLLIQNRNFDAVMQKQDRWIEPQVYQEGESEWIFHRFYDFLPNGLIRFNIATLKRMGEREWKSGVISTLLMPQLYADLTSVLASAGFSEVQSYGSASGEPFNPAESGNLILTGRKQL